jgi:hypothetical protein
LSNILILLCEFSFYDRVSLTLPWLALNGGPPASASGVAGTVDIHHHAWLTFSLGDLRCLSQQCKADTTFDCLLCVYLQDSVPGTALSALDFNACHPRSYLHEKMLLFKGLLTEEGRYRSLCDQVLSHILPTPVLEPSVGSGCHCLILIMLIDIVTGSLRGHPKPPLAFKALGKNKEMLKSLFKKDVYFKCLC